MTEEEIQILKDNVDRLVKIRTKGGEELVAKVLFVAHSVEDDEHDLLYEVISSNKMEWYVQHQEAGGYVLDFNDVVSLNAAQAQNAKV